MKVNDDVEVTEKETKKKSRKLLGYVLFLLFGLGTWLNLNGIWIELPLLVPRLPEGWALSAELGMASNLANVGPLLIALIRRLVGESADYEVPSIIVIFGVGISVPLALSLTWFRKVYLFGRFRSLYLLIFGFCLALVNCTSSVTYLPFVNRFDPKWLNIYFAGESLSSLVPAMLGLLQGVGHETKCVPVSINSTELKPELSSPRFSIDIYLVCLSVIMSISFVAFLALWRTQPRSKAKVNEPVEQVIAGENPMSALLTVNSDEVIVKVVDSQEEEKFTTQTMIYLSIILWTSILLIGCIPSINSYSINPYGAKTFHYVIILCQCCYPLVSLIATLRPLWFKVSTVTIGLTTTAGTLAFIYIFVTALKSPCSPFVDYAFGKYFIGVMWLFVYLVFYYERIALGNHFNETSGHRGLFWYGLLTQAGAFLGATFIYFLTRFDVFKERDFCTNYDCS